MERLVITIYVLICLLWLRWAAIRFYATIYGPILPDRHRRHRK